MCDRVHILQFSPFSYPSNFLRSYWYKLYKDYEDTLIDWHKDLLYHYRYCLPYRK